MKTGVAYLGSREPECIRQHMDDLVSQGYTHVCHPYSEEDFTYYRETMREVIGVSVKSGLGVYVIPWGIGRVFDGEGFSGLAVEEQMLQSSNHGKSAAAACPNRMRFRDYIREWTSEICSTKAEAILWDNPHFYDANPEEQWSCRCEECKKLFRKATGHIMPNSLTDSVRQFRVSSIIELLSEMTGLSRLSGKRNAVCFSQEDGSLMSDLLREAAGLPTVDELVIKPYWSSGDRVADISRTYHEMSRKLLDLAQESGKEAQVWIKNFLIQTNNEDSVAEATYAAYNEGVRNLFAWAHRGTRTMSAFRSENPDKVWKIQTDAFAECHDKAIMNEMVDTMLARKSEEL